MISGTSKILSKAGPGNLLTITKRLQRIQEHFGIILENIIFVNLGLTKFRNELKSVCPTYQVLSIFLFVFCFPDFLVILSTNFENAFVEMRIEK